MIKLHNNDRSNKSSILDKKSCHLRLSALALGLCIKSCKIDVISEFKAVLLNLQQMFRVIIAFCDDQNLPHWSYLPLPPHV